MLAFVAAALLASTPSPAPTSLPSVADIIARHRSALGRIASSTARWTGTIHRTDGDEHFEVIADYTGRYRETWTTPIAAHAEGSNGITDWVQDENGDVIAKPTDHSFSYEFALVRLNDLRIDDPSHASVTGTIALDGRQAYVVKIEGGDHATTLYFDQKTYLLDGAD